MYENEFSAEIKNIIDLTDGEIELWKNIQAQSFDLQQAFLSYSFCSAVAANNPFVRICIIKKHQDIVAFLPFQFKDKLHEKLRIAERVGGELSDYFGIVAVPDFVIRMKSLASLTGLNLLHFTHLDDSQRTYGFCNESPERGLRIIIGASADNYFEKLKENNNKLVSDTGRRQRKIEKDIGPLRFCFNVQKEMRKNILADLVQYKRDQYTRTDVLDSLKDQWKQQVLFQLLSTEDHFCKGILSTLYAGDVWVASHFGLQCNDALHFWFPVYNKDLAKYSPGRLLMKQVIMNAPSQHPPIAIIDRGAGVSKAKTDFANAEHIYYRGEISKPGITTLSYKVFRSIKWRLQALRK